MVPRRWTAASNTAVSAMARISGRITQASAGQRSAAMLAFLLAHGEEPLVLDQPEGDLDNHLIYDLIVRQIQGAEAQTADHRRYPQPESWS